MCPSWMDLIVQFKVTQQCLVGWTSVTLELTVNSRWLNRVIALGVPYSSYGQLNTFSTDTACTSYEWTPHNTSGWLSQSSGVGFRVFLSFTSYTTTIWLTSYQGAGFVLFLGRFHVSILGGTAMLPLVGLLSSWVDSTYYL